MIKNQEFTYIGKNANIEGDFVFDGPTHIQGKIKGNIKAIGLSPLVIEINSVISGNLIGNDIEIYGHFEGEIHAHGTVRIFPTGSFQGKISTRMLEIYPGSIVNVDAHTTI